MRIDGTVEETLKSWHKMVGMVSLILFGCVDQYGELVAGIKCAGTDKNGDTFERRLILERGLFRDRLCNFFENFMFDCYDGQERKVKWGATFGSAPSSATPASSTETTSSPAEKGTNTASAALSSGAPASSTHDTANTNTMSTRAEKGTNADTRPSAGTLESTPDTPQADSVVGSTTAISSAAPASSAHDSVNGKTMSTSVDNGMAGSTTTASSSATPASSTHDSVDGKTNTFADKQINADAAPSVRTSDPTTERVGLSAGDTAVADGKETSPLSAGPQETITSPGNKESRAETPQQ
ncbi:hypothetical protein CERSUDRAFT_78790, partial [Gelatoporia subvermispora B]